MTIIDGWELEELQEKRPRLKEELHRLGEPLEVWRMNDQATTRAADIAGKKTLLLLAKIRERDGKEIHLLIMSQPGKDGAANSWLFNPADLPAAPPPNSNDYIVIDKSKVGRPRRELTDVERQEIRARHEAGENINKIAKALKMGTRRIMEALKE